MTFRIEDCYAAGETDKCVFVRSEDDDAPDDLLGSDDCAVPKSQIDGDSEVYRADTQGVLIVTDWFARQRGWTED